MSRATRVYLSGGAERTTHWGLAHKKANVAELLLLLDPKIEFVHSGKAKYIVIPDWLDDASDTAKKTGGTVLKVSAYVRKLKKTASAARKAAFQTRLKELTEKDEEKEEGASSKKHSVKKRVSTKKKASKKRASTKKKTSNKRASAKRTPSRKR